MTAACLPFPLAAMAAAPTPAEGAPVRTDADPQAADAFSDLISMLIPEAAPERPQGGIPRGKPEKNDSGEPKEEEQQQAGQTVVLPFPVQAFVPPVEIQSPVAGGHFAIEVAVAPEQKKTEADAPAAEMEAGQAPAVEQPGAPGPVERPETAEVPTVAPPLAALPDAVEKPAERTREARQQPGEAGPPPAPEASVACPAPAATPAPAPASVPAPAPAAPPEPLAASAAPAAHSSAPPRTMRSPEATGLPAKKDADRTPAEPKSEAPQAAKPSKQPSADAELAFAARMTERAAATVDPARRIAPDSSQEPPQRIAVEQAEARPNAPEAEPAREATASHAPEREPVTRNRTAEPEERAAAPARPAAGKHFVEPAGHQPPAPAQPARAAAPAPAAPAERVTAPKPAIAVDFEPARAEAAAQPVREFAMVVPRQASETSRPEPVEVKVLERAGQVHVAVRSADPQLNRSLGEGLGELVANLESRGYATETWRPQSSGAAHATLAAAAEGPVQQAQAGSGHESFQESGRGHQGGAGDESSGQQRRGQQEDRPRWLEMLEGAVRQRSSNPIRSTFTWQQK